MSTNQTKNVYSVSDVAERWGCPEAEVLSLMRVGEMLPAVDVLRKAFLFWPDAENPEEWAGKWGEDFMVAGYVYFDFSRATENSETGIIVREAYPSALTRCVGSEKEPWKDREAEGTDIGFCEPLRIDESSDLYITAEQIAQFESEYRPGKIVEDASISNNGRRENNRSRLLGIITHLYIEACTREPNEEQRKADVKRFYNNGQISVIQLCSDIREAAKRINPDSIDGLQKGTTHPLITRALRNIDLDE